MTRFVFEAEGWHVKRSDANGAIVYVGNHYEKNTGTGVVTKYYYLGGQRVAMRVGSTLYYLFSDHLGSSSVSYRSDGGQTISQRYYPWGTVRPGPNNGLPTDYTFTGQKLDESIKLMYYGARYYDGTLGRFIQTDTLVPEPGNPQALNRYAYTLNNPLKYTDPTGHFTEDELRQWGITDELMRQWKQDFAWWAIIETAQLGDLVQSVGRLTGSAGVWSGIFGLYPNVGQPMLGMATTEDRGWVGVRDRGVLDPEAFRARTQEVGRSLWRPNEQGNKQAVRTPQYLVGPASGWIIPVGPNWSPIMVPLGEGARGLREITSRLDPFTPNELSGASISYKDMVAQGIDSVVPALYPSLAGKGRVMAEALSVVSLIYNVGYDNLTGRGPYYVGQYVH